MFVLVVPIAALLEPLDVKVLHAARAIVRIIDVAAGQRAAYILGYVVVDGPRATRRLAGIVLEAVQSRVISKDERKKSSSENKEVAHHGSCVCAIAFLYNVSIYTLALLPRISHVTEYRNAPCPKFQP